MLTRPAARAVTELTNTDLANFQAALREQRSFRLHQLRSCPSVRETIASLPPGSRSPTCSSTRPGTRSSRSTWRSTAFAVAATGGAWTAARESAATASKCSRLPPVACRASTASATAGHRRAGTPCAAPRRVGQGDRRAAGDRRCSCGRSRGTVRRLISARGCNSRSGGNDGHDRRCHSGGRVRQRRQLVSPDAKADLRLRLGAPWRAGERSQEHSGGWQHNVASRPERSFYHCIRINSWMRRRR